MLDRKFIGYEFGVVETTIPRWKVSKFANAIKDHNPIFYDIEEAKKQGYRDIPVPPTFYATMTFSDDDFFGTLGIDYRKLLDGGREFEYYSDCCAGDTITYQTIVESITEKEGKRGKMDIVKVVTNLKLKDSEEKILDMIINLVVFH